MGSTRCWGILSLAMFLLIALAVVGRAQSALRDGMEGPETSWRIGDSDTSFRVQRHVRIQQGAHSGDWCEFLQVSAAAGGSHLHLVREIGQARVIEELSPAIWIKANRTGAQILARAVLPRNIDPKTGKPLHLLVRGSAYSQPGHWQELRIDDVGKQLKREAWILQLREGVHVDTREAYLDRVVINAYAGAGLTQIFLDDLEITGFVGDKLVGDGGVEAADADGQAGRVLPVRARPDVQRDGSLLSIAGRPVFPRIIQYQGESLEYLKGLGFNAVQMRESPSGTLLAEAARTGVWLIAPPPPVANDESRFVSSLFGPRTDWVLAWDLGHGLSSEQYEDTRRWAAQLRRLDHRVTRPLVCDAVSDLRAYSRHVDLLHPYRFPLGTTLELTDYAAWLRQRPSLARPGTPFWTSIQTQMSKVLREQQRLLTAGEPPEPVVDVDQIRLLVFSALSAGARGLCFQSQSRLDEDPLRAKALELINLELSLIEPWTAAGTLSAIVPGNHPHVVATVLQNQRSRLLLPMWRGPGSQYVGGQAAGNGISFVIPGVPETNEAFRLTPGGMPRVSATRKTGGVRVTLEEFGPTAMILLTQDPLTISAVARRIAAMSGRAAQLQQELAAAKLAQVERLDRQLTARGVSIPFRERWLARAKTLMRQCNVSGGRGNHEQTYLAARRALRPARMLERAYWDQIAARLDSTAVSPLVATSATLPWHLEFMNKLQSARRAPNQLPDGDCENLLRMLSAGWRHLRHEQPGILTTAELSPGNPHSGRFSLRMSAKPRNPEQPPGLVETPPVWVTSAPVARSRMLAERSGNSAWSARALSASSPKSKSWLPMAAAS